MEEDEEVKSCENCGEDLSWGEEYICTNCEIELEESENYEIS